MEEKQSIDEEKRASVEIYTDGACSGNPGPGGYGAVLIYGDVRKEISEGYKLTTNNRMELMAAIKGLEQLKNPCDVTLYSDSKYLVDGVMKGWAKKWRANGWMRNKTEKALNDDLWKRLLTLLDKHNVTFKWIKGHANNIENEKCDVLATNCVKSNLLLDDENFMRNFYK
ncbi:MAG: ribonuclease HI [Clostridiales bacterium]|nr:ribonuclease HI [Clostridiales bacterium]